MKVSQTPGAGVRARHGATLPLDGPPDDTTIRWRAEIVRGTNDTARGIRTTRSSASESPEGPEEKITIEIRTEPGEDDEGAAWIKYENNSVTLGGEGLDEDIALQWMKRLSARLLHPEERECAQEAPQETSAEPIETYLAEGIPPEGCIATEDGTNCHLDARTLLARRTEQMKAMHADVRAAAKSSDVAGAVHRLRMLEHKTQDDSTVIVAERNEGGWIRYIGVPIPDGAREKLRWSMTKALNSIVSRACGTRPGKVRLKATMEATRILGEMAARNPKGSTREWTDDGWEHAAVAQAGAVATLAYAEGWMHHRAAHPTTPDQVGRAITALAERGPVERGHQPVVARRVHEMLLSAGTRPDPQNQVVLKMSIPALTALEAAGTLKSGRAESLAVCARRVLARTEPEERDRQWDAIIETIATSDTPGVASAMAIRAHWMGGFKQPESDALIWALERRTEPIRGGSRASALRTMAKQLPELRDPLILYMKNP